MMRRLLRLALGGLLMLVLLLGCQQLRNSGGPEPRPSPENGIRVTTYNVHYILMNQAEGRWSRGAWERRKAPLDATFKAIDADIVAFQEMESFAGGDDDSVNLARFWLLEQNPGYAAAAIGDWRSFPSTQPISYRMAKFEEVDKGWFFFSETPEVIYSRTFDGSYPAFASWADLRARDTGRTIRVLNAHLDYSSRENRRKSTAFMVERVSAWRAEGRRVLLAADLNARLGSDLHDAHETAGLRFLPVEGATYHFDLGLNLFGAIDHIALSPELTETGPPVVFREKLGAVWPTDHYPVFVDIAAAGAQ
ncbi:endonuclease/exonuclease/phosphatase family protein [Litorisediminicola beolgyonensis]|uniref:Endonuclease/exonuclease/phosphatase family protein n=1 Tax=Litorisediminicola beolgyonensis TaxID=1173614 RepID=A0ABW3ZGW9_9RHOB